MRRIEQVKAVDYKAVQTFIEDGCSTNTYRPCYVFLVCKTICGKLRVSIHLTIEGYAMSKYDRFDNLRHVYGKGTVGKTNIGCIYTGKKDGEKSLYIYNSNFSYQK